MTDLHSQHINPEIILKKCDSCGLETGDIDKKFCVCCEHQNEDIYNYYESVCNVTPNTTGDIRVCSQCKTSFHVTVLMHEDTDVCPQCIRPALSFEKIVERLESEQDLLERTFTCLNYGCDSLTSRDEMVCVHCLRQLQYV